MEWGNSSYTDLSLHVSALIDENGVDEAFNLLIRASQESADPQRSHALAYVAASIDTEVARKAAEAFRLASASRKAKIDSCNKIYSKLCDLVDQIDFNSLDFWDLLQEKHHTSFILNNVQLNPRSYFRQPAELIAKDLSDFTSRAVELDKNPNDTDSFALRMEVRKYLTQKLVPQLERQIELFKYFTEYYSNFLTMEQKQKFSTHAYLEVAPGKLHELVSKGALYRNTKIQLGKIGKCISEFNSSLVKMEEAEKPYNASRNELCKLIPCDLGNYIDGFWDVNFLVRGKDEVSS